MPMKLALCAATVAVLALVGQAPARTSSESSPSTSIACAPGYRPCLPVRADLDCDQIAERLKPIRVTGADPYDLDRDGDGLGCEADWGDGGSGALSRWGLIIRKPLRKEAQTVSVGNTVWAAGWSPKSFKGRRFDLCAAKAGGRCVRAPRALNGRNQVFGTWKVAARDVSGGSFRLRLRVQGRARAVDAARVQ